jgi:YesN/AraC family two-component response regulator
MIIPIERFWSKVEKKGEDECWNWTGSISTSKYGQINIDHKNYTAHRIVYELIKGEIPAGLFVCHKCDNTLCCNPFHLFLGTYQDNMDDMKRKGRQNKLSGEKHPSFGKHRSTEVKDKLRLKNIGENNPNSKLSEKDIKEIRGMYKNKIPQKQIAKQFGICHDYVSTIVRNESWRHV